MDADLELDAWRRDWQGGTGIPDILTARVERETRRMRWIVGGEIAVTVLFGGGSLAWALVSGREDIQVLAIGIWTFIAVAWVTSWLLRRGAWTPLTSTTAAFLELSILRCRRRREIIPVQGVLYVAILTFDLWWIHAHSPPHAAMDLGTFLTRGPVLCVWLITAGLAVLSVRYRRRLDRELDGLLRLRHETDGHEPHTQESTTWHAPAATVKKSRKRTFSDR